MPTANKTEQGVVERYYDMMRIFGDAELVETNKGMMFIMPEDKLKTVILDNLLRAYELGKLSKDIKEEESGFDIKSYLIRK